MYMIRFMGGLWRFLIMLYQFMVFKYAEMQKKKKFFVTSSLRYSISNRTSNQTKNTNKLTWLVKLSHVIFQCFSNHGNNLLLVIIFSCRLSRNRFLRMFCGHLSSDYTESGSGFAVTIKSMQEIKLSHKGRECVISS